MKPTSDFPYFNLFGKKYLTLEEEFDQMDEKIKGYKLDYFYLY